MNLSPASCVHREVLTALDYSRLREVSEIGPRWKRGWRCREGGKGGHLVAQQGSWLLSWHIFYSLSLQAVVPGTWKHVAFSLEHLFSRGSQNNWVNQIDWLVCGCGLCASQVMGKRRDVLGCKGYVLKTFSWHSIVNLFWP